MSMSLDASEAIGQAASSSSSQGEPAIASDKIGGATRIASGKKMTDAKAKQAWRRFTPAKINPRLCMARTWSGGRGGQCKFASASSGTVFCKKHMGGTWRIYGRVNGPIPAKKLAEFQAAFKKRPPPVRNVKHSAKKDMTDTSLAICRGSIVRLHSLVSQPTLNGKKGICMTPVDANDKETRWVVHVDGDPVDELKRLHPKNLEVFANPGCAAMSPSALACSLASLEGEALGQCEQSQRGDVKRKILLRWHPDKAPSRHHVNFATLVTQELTALPAWQGGA